MAKSNLTAERLRELLHYDQETGIFTWIVNRQWNAMCGDIAGAEIRSKCGYICFQIYIDGTPYKSHRLAFLYVKGRWPLEVVDHINTNSLDNRFSNLREATANINAQNRTSAHKHSSSGVLGVSPSGKNWRAGIRVNGKRISIGSYPTKELAYEAYVKTKRMLHEGCTI